MHALANIPHPGGCGGDAFVWYFYPSHIFGDIHVVYINIILTCDNEYMTVMCSVLTDGRTVSLWTIFRDWEINVLGFHSSQIHPIFIMTLFFMTEIDIFMERVGNFLTKNML